MHPEHTLDVMWKATACSYDVPGLLPEVTASGGVAPGTHRGKSGLSGVPSIISPGWTFFLLLF